MKQTSSTNIAIQQTNCLVRHYRSWFYQNKTKWSALLPARAIYIIRVLIDHMPPPSATPSAFIAAILKTLYLCDIKHSLSQLIIDFGHFTSN